MNSLYEAVERDDQDIVTFINQNYKDNSKFEIMLYDKLLHGKSLTIFFLIQFSLLFLTILLAKSIGFFFFGIFSSLFLVMLYILVYTVDKHGERSFTWYDKEKKFKLNKMYQLENEPKEVKIKK